MKKISLLEVRAMGFFRLRKKVTCEDYGVMLAEEAYAYQAFPQISMLIVEMRP